MIMLEEQQEDLRKKRCADRYDSSESSDSGVAALSGGESLSSCGSSNNGDGILTSPPCSPASSGELIICDDNNSTTTTGSGVDQLLHGRILTSGLSSNTSSDETKEEAKNSFNIVVDDKDKVGESKSEIDSDKKLAKNDETSHRVNLSDVSKNGLPISNCSVVAVRISDDLNLRNSDYETKSKVAEKDTEVGASFVDKVTMKVQDDSENIDTNGKKEELLEENASPMPDCKVAIVSPLISQNALSRKVEDNTSEKLAETNSLSAEVSSVTLNKVTNSSNEVNLAELTKENQTANSNACETANTANNITLENVSSQNSNCINTFTTLNNGVVNFSTFSNTNTAQVFPTADASNGAVVNGLLLQQPNMNSPQNIKFLQCVTNNGIMNSQVRICNNSPSILLNNAGFPLLKNNQAVLGAIQNNLSAANGGGQVAVTTWNGSPILINANALTTNLNQLNNLTNNNLKKCNSANQVQNNPVKVCNKILEQNGSGKISQVTSGNKRPSPVKEQIKSKGIQNNLIAPCPAKKPRSACKTEQQKHNTRTAQHSCCPNKNKLQINNNSTPTIKTDHITKPQPATAAINNNSSKNNINQIEKPFNGVIDPVVINALQKNCVSIQQISGNKNLVMTPNSNNKNLVITQNTINTTQLIVQQNNGNSKLTVAGNQQPKCQSPCSNNREITNYFKAQVKPQRRASDNSQVLANSAKLVATQSDYLAMLTAKTHANQQVLLEKRSYDVRTLTLATPPILNNNNQLANHNNNISNKASQQHLINGITTPLAQQQQNSFKIGAIEVSLNANIASKQTKMTNDVFNRQPAAPRKPRGRPCVNIAPRVAKKPKCIAPKTDLKPNKITQAVTAQPVVTAANTVPAQQNMIAVSQHQATTVAPQTVLLTTYTTNLPGQQNLAKLPAGLILNGTPSGIRFQQSPQPVYVAANPFLQPVYVTKPFLQPVGYGAPQFTQFATAQFQQNTVASNEMISTPALVSNDIPALPSSEMIGSNNFGSIVTTPDKDYVQNTSTENAVSQLTLANESITLENPVVSSITLDKSVEMECDNKDQSLISENAVSCQSIDESLCDPVNSITETASTFNTCKTEPLENSAIDSSLPEIDISKTEPNDSFNAKTDNSNLTILENSIDNSIQNDDIKPEPEIKEILKEIQEPKSPKSLILERIQQKLDSENSFSSSFEEERKSTEPQEPRVIRFPAKFPCNGRSDSSRLSRDNFGAGRCVWEKCHGNFDTSSALLEHLQVSHVNTQSGPRYCCQWRGCRVYGRESSSRRWLDAHVASVHAGSTKTLQCIVAGCRRRFSSQLALQRHVNNHFNESEGNGANAKKSQEPHLQGSAAALKLIRKNGKKLRYRRQPWSARMFDFFDGGAMEGLQYRLLCTEALAGGAKGTVLLRSDILGRRLDSTGNAQVLVSWNPPDILPDEWISESDYTPTKEVDIRKLPTDSKCEISNQIEALTKKQEKVPRKQSRKHKRSDGESSTTSSSLSSTSSSYSSSVVASWFDL